MLLDDADERIAATKQVDQAMSSIAGILASKATSNLAFLKGNEPDIQATQGIQRTQNIVSATIFNF